jgi:tetratricopeptide (TPR) repeat protein
LSGLVRGEPDWIVMKCLEKDRNRRYETANGLALDLQRYLAGEPVAAGPPSANYLLRKFAHKHRAALMTAAAITLLLVVGVAVSTWEAVRATRAEARAVQAQETEKRRAEEETKAKQEAQKRLAQIEKGNEILLSIFADLDIRGVKAGTEPLEAVLAGRLVQAADQLEGEAIGNPLVVARLQNRLGNTLLSLGSPGKAVPLFLKVRETRTAHLGPDHLDTLTSMNNLALGYHSDGKLEQALPLYEETLKRMKARLGADHPNTLSCMNNLASAYTAVRKLESALPLLEETLKLRKAVMGADHPDTLTCMNNLAMGYQAPGKPEQALPLYQETLKLRKALLGADHPDTLSSMNNLAFGYLAAGKPDQALPLYQETLKLRTVRLGAEHPDTLRSMGNLAVGYKCMGKLEQALPLFQDAAQRIEKKGFQHQDASGIVNNLIDCYEQLKQFDQAELWRRKWQAAGKEPVVVRLPDKAPARPAEEPAVRARPEPAAFRVTAATLQAEPREYSGPVPARILFRGKITTDGPGTVHYTFLRSDGARGPTFTLIFDRAGTKEVSTGWVGGAGSKLEFWEILKVQAPNEVISDKAHVKIECKK